MTSPGPSKQRRSRPGGRSARVRTKVLTAALDAVAETGYDAMSIEGVAAAAGVHKTTVYRRWPSKAQLVIDALLQRSQNEISVPDTGSLAGDLGALGHAVAASLRTTEAQRFARSLVAAAAASPELAREAEAFWAERVRQNRIIIERATDRGEASTSADAGLLIEMLLGALWFRMLFAGEPPDDSTVRQVADVIAGGAAGA